MLLVTSESTNEDLPASLSRCQGGISPVTPGLYVHARQSVCVPVCWCGYCWQSGTFSRVGLAPSSGPVVWVPVGLGEVVVAQLQIAVSTTTLRA
ncbi:unnamed protein product [Protopolystoma xenopodis]|uniref:Uncharacterized protein n=1 Tax=Protopolystoma xenopodis TaxID=117903 RepID=A0A3S5CIU6_9PLAT|nr:unnamed protein product [Protopolystoma xenopodis]